MFYTFDQNNSGGSFVLDKEQGLTAYVIIEADSREAAIDKAEDIGIYFDGCFHSRDCSCCGDRWSRPWDDVGSEEPLIYDTPAKEHFTKERGYKPIKWMEEGHEICIHYKDGRKEWI